MPVTLKITFTGLFAFVPDERERSVIALLPGTGFMNGNRVHQHHATMEFSRSYLKQAKLPKPPEKAPGCVESAETQSTGSGDLGHDHQDHEANAGGDAKNDETIPLGRVRVTLIEMTGSEFIHPPAASANLYDITKKGLDREQIGEAPRDSVWGQIVLPGAGKELTAGKKAKWKLKGSEEALSHELYWETTFNDQDSITFELQHLRGTGVREKVTLSPNEKGGTIEVSFRHLPDRKDEHPGRKCYTAPHFDAYYDLYRDTITDRPHPFLNERPIEKGADVFTCMTAQVPLE